MTEPRKTPPALISNAIEKAREAGRTDLADFIELRLENDRVRTKAVNWLVDTMISIASGMQGRFPMLTIQRAESHQFRLRGAELTGTLLELRLGVRCLTLEAGWTRMPGDGFMRGGALAFAKLTHFGLPKQNIELLLLKNDENPIWNITGQAEGTAVFEEVHVRQQFELFMDGVL